MSISWYFDSTGQFDTPVLILENRFKYIPCGRNSGGDVKFFRCIQWQSGCEARVSIGSTYHEEGGGEGWGFITQYLLDHTPVGQHTCSHLLDDHLVPSTNDDMQILENLLRQI